MVPNGINVCPLHGRADQWFGRHRGHSRWRRDCKVKDHGFNEKHQRSSIGYPLPIQFDDADHAAHKTVAAASKASYEQLFQGFSILSAWLDLSPERNHMRAGIHLFPRTEDT